MSTKDPTPNVYAPPADPSASPADQADSRLTRDEVAAFVGRNEAYYFRLLVAGVGDTKVISFNPAAFLVSYFWLLYRKLWIELVLLLGATIALGVVQQVLGDEGAALERGMEVAMAAGFAMLANWIYLRRVRHQILEARSTIADPAARLAWLKQRGGTSRLAIVLGTAMFLAIVAVLAVLSSSS